MGFRRVSGAVSLVLELEKGEKKMAFRGGRNFGERSFGPREMHKAICSECKQECEVPFKPTEGRAVFCRDCFQKNKRF